MFGIPGKPPVTMTPAAQAQIARLMTRGETKGLRIGVKKGGCAGMEYTVELANDERPREDSVEREGARVFVAPEAVLFLLGTEMDYEETRLRSGFTFRNPNQTSACGCGESVELKAADLEAMASARSA